MFTRLHFIRQTGVWLLLLVLSTASTWAQVVISQVYGGGGNAGSTLRNDFVELFNRGASPVAIGGWSVQYASATGTTWAPTSLTGTIPAGGYYLVQLAAGTGGTANLPTPDAIGNTAVSGTAGKFALVNVITALSGTCPTGSGIVDFVGFGTTANCFEGAGPTPAPSNTTAVLRASNGCTDAGQNATDFVAGPPNPRNSTSASNPCAAPPVGSPTLAATPNSLTGANGLSYATGSGPDAGPPASGSVSVSGANFATATGTITATSSSTAFTVTPTSAPFSGSALSATSFTIQLVSGLSVGSHAATITFEGGGATALVQVSGSVTNANAPGTLIRAIQGAGHISPLAGQAVASVPGIVTTLRTTGFWMQDPNPDTDDNTSEGIFVFTSMAPTVAVGQAVQVSGTVQELRLTANNLSSTQLTGPTISVVSSGNALPAPIVISSQAGTGVRRIPTNVISNDFPASGDVELSVFDPTEDGLDFFETLEGMRVQINNPVTTSFRNGFGEVFVIADAGAGATGLNARKTLTISGANTTDINSAITNSDFNPERIQIDDVLYGTGNTPNQNLGTLLNTIVGVVNYDFQSYEVLPSVAPTVSPSNVPLTKETTNLTPTTNQLTIASFNVENLGGDEPQAKYDGLAAAIKNNLASPDILALEEIQDNNGATNNGEVDATTTLNRLVAAITAAGGPAYQYRQINPVNNQDGGEPGGNIRVGLLYNPARVQFVDRPGGGPAINTTVSNAGGQPLLSASPGRILDPNPGETDSFIGDDFTSTRKPLVGEFTFNGQTVYVIVNHFSSRGGSGPLTGRFQPPVQSEQGRREEQGKVVNAFVDQLLSVNPNTNVVVLGDFNEFQFLPALQFLTGNVNGEAPVLTNLIESLPVQERYTYTFDGNAQALDYILASNALNSNLDAFDAIHLNAEFLDQLSDHDPSVARFTIAATTTPPSGTALTLLTPTYNCATGDITFNTSGGDGTTITYTAIGVQRSSLTSNTGVVEAGLRSDPKPLNIVATQSGNTVSIPFDFAAFCANPGSGTGTTPPIDPPTCSSPANTIGQPLQVRGVTDVNCQTGSFRILTTGGNGQSISYANNVGLSNDDPTNCVRRLDSPGLIQAINNPNSDIGPFGLRLMQGATQSNTFTFNFKQFCTGAGRMATESLGELAVTVLGNPTHTETVEVIVSNTAGERIELWVSNAQGQVISRVSANSTGNMIRQRIELGRSVGLYLLQVNTPTRTKTVKVVRQ